MTIERLHSRVLLLIGICVLLGAGDSVFAQPYPVKPVRVIVGYPPGAGNDVIGRLEKGFCCDGTDTTWAEQL